MSPKSSTYHAASALPPASQPINPIPAGFPADCVYDALIPLDGYAKNNVKWRAGVLYTVVPEQPLAPAFITANVDGSKMYFYPIVVGLKVGIVTDVNEASTLTNGVTGGFFKKCHCQSAAIAYFNSALAEGKVCIGQLRVSRCDEPVGKNAGPPWRLIELSLDEEETEPSLTSTQESSLSESEPSVTSTQESSLSESEHEESQPADIADDVVDGIADALAGLNVNGSPTSPIYAIKQGEEVTVTNHWYEAGYHQQLEEAEIKHFPGNLYQAYVSVGAAEEAFRYASRQGYVCDADNTGPLSNCRHVRLLAPQLVLYPGDTPLSEGVAHSAWHVVYVGTQPGYTDPMWKLQFTISASLAQFIMLWRRMDRLAKPISRRVARGELFMSDPVTDRNPSVATKKLVPASTSQSLYTNVPMDEIQMGRRKRYNTQDECRAARAASDAKYYERASILSKRNARLPRQDVTLTIFQDVASLTKLCQQLHHAMSGSPKDFGEFLYATVMDDEDRAEHFIKRVEDRFCSLRRAASSVCADIGRKAGQDSVVWTTSMDTLKDFALALKVVEDIHSHVVEDPLFFQMAQWHEKRSHLDCIHDMVGSRASSPLRTTVSSKSAKSSAPKSSKKTSTARISTGGRLLRPPAPPRPVLVQAPLDLARLTANTTKNHLSVKSRMHHLRRPRVDYELGTAQKYLDNYDPATYTHDSWVPHDEAAGFRAATLTLDIRTHERRQHLREALVLGKGWRPFRRALRAFARPIPITLVEL
ncbi:hypothetical protein BDZ89DRAFT_1052264 [Hymenopellis radicata]|nr:hypothetical protein BDZ89DRAFT_1052264 [Hymenopellis radicata]